ncbi:CC157 protein, partial [Hemiprocne comata]|nr:CC157 protein [Hemiprocne comata]
MAHLLGHPGCMDSLRADLRDLQTAITDVSSQAGAMHFPSWKFPDKVSCELDLVVLLERYQYTENDPEFTQHSHVVLLELVIDRLLLLLQSFTGYAENLLRKRAVSLPQAVGPWMSAGLTARRAWASLLKLGALYQQLLDQKKARGTEIPLLPSTPQAGKPEKLLKSWLPNLLKLRTSTEVAQPVSWHPSSSVPAPDSDTLGTNLPRAACSTPKSSSSVPSLPRAACNMAKSSSSVATQTIGWSQGPCDSCSSVQASLCEVGRAITSICRSQNIPSALSKFQEMVEESMGRRTLSAMDVSYWASEQSKDLSRISKHLQMLLQQVNPLRAQLEESEEQKNELRKQVEDVSQLLRAEKETQARQKKEAEQRLEAKNKEHLEAVARLERDKDDLQRGKALLPASPPSPGVLCQRCCISPEVTKTTLLEEMRTRMVAKSQMLELEEKVQLLTGQQESMGEELSATTIQLDKEKAKVESVLRHQESLQAKQKALLQQLDSLDQEREELQDRLEEAEEDKARLQQQLEESQEQSRQQLQAQQENVSKLEEQAQELKEREKLLVFFPELHIPVEAQFESTGSWTEDMEKQIQANSIRMAVLEQENVRLWAALAKVKAAAEQGVLE